MGVYVCAFIYAGCERFIVAGLLSWSKSRSLSSALLGCWLVLLEDAVSRLFLI